MEDGKRIEKWKTTGLPLANNKRRAQEIANERACKFRKLAEEKNRMESWGLDTSVPDMLFSDLMQQWKLRKAPAISKSTLEGYEHILRYADPFFRSRNITVQQVTPALIQRYLDSLQEGRTKPLSGNTIKKHIVLLKSVFNESIKDGTLVYNPVRRIAPPKIVPYQAQTYSASELNELFEALKGSSIEDIVRVTAFYGLRRSKVCGLRWQDVDFEQNTIYIRHKVLEIRINGQSEVMQTNELKTESSRRAFALVPTIRELLLKRRQWTEENRRLWGDCYDHTYDEYIFNWQTAVCSPPSGSAIVFAALSSGTVSRKFVFTICATPAQRCCCTRAIPCRKFKCISVTRPFRRHCVMRIWMLPRKSRHRTAWSICLEMVKIMRTSRIHCQTENARVLNGSSVHSIKCYRLMLQNLTDCNCKI